MESRKRLHTDDDEPTTHKKRILASPNGEPHVNGAAEEEEEPSQLESFRKEAIFRKMKHYSREQERSQLRIAELEKRRNTCDAGLAAISACWSQLVETIRSLARPEELPPPDDRTKDLFSLQSYIVDDSLTDLKAALKDSSDATHTLVSRFVQSGGQPNSALFKDETYRKYQKSQSECAVLRSEVQLMRTRLQDSEAQKEKYHSELVAAEVRCDRLRSKTVQAIQPKSRVSADAQDTKDDVVEEPQRKPPSPALPATSMPINGSADRDVSPDAGKELADFREEQIRKLEEENAKLRDEVHNLKLQTRLLSMQAVVASPYYQQLMDRATKLDHTVKESEEKIAQLTKEVEEHTQREQLETANAAAVQENTELKSMLARRDADLTRLREIRDQQIAELNERKQKDAVKLNSLDEYRRLVRSQTERITALESQLKRHKAQLAAHTGNEDLMKFLLGDQSEESSYIPDLRRRLDVAEARAAALELALSQGNSTDVQAHAEALEKLSLATVELEKYRATYGDASSQPPDVSSLADQLQKKEEEIQRLRLVDSQREFAETALYAELDKLSAAWETLDKQVKSKAFDLTAMEEKLAKAVLDRAKSENKFYTSMRDKEAIENERKSLVRNLEKQAKLVERLVDTEKNLSSQVGELETQIKKHKEYHETVVNGATELHAEYKKSQHDVAAAQNRARELEVLRQESEQALGLEKAELRKKQEGLLKAKKEQERQLAKAMKAAASATSSVPSDSEAQKELDGLTAYLRCSTCSLNFREVIITKCMHTFCKACVEARLTTRQRKCPHCNLAFSQSDVHPIFMQ